MMFRAAQKLQSEVVASRTSILGGDHPDTLVAKSAQAVTLFAEENFTAASKLQTALVESMDRVLGEKHPDTLRTRTNLAKTLYKAGNVKRAAEIFSAVKATQAQVGAAPPPLRAPPPIA